eukprot:7384499-Prymnesium_polylepis.1
MLAKKAKALVEQGKLADALKNFNIALTILSKHGANDPKTNIVLRSKADVLKKQFKLDEAMEACLSAKEAFQRSNEEVEVAITLSSIGDIHDRQHNYDKALQAYEEALRLKQAKLGLEHVSCAITIAGLGNVYRHQHKLREAMGKYEEAMALWKRARQERTPDAAITLTVMGITEHELGPDRYDAAVEYFDQALDILKGTRGEGSHRYAEALAHKAAVYIAQSKLEKAVEELDQALRIVEDTYG